MTCALKSRQKKKTLSITKVPVRESLLKAAPDTFNYLRQSLEEKGSLGIDLLYHSHASSHHFTTSSDTTPIAHFES